MPSHSTTVGPCYGARKKSKPKQLPNSERPKRVRRGRKAGTHKQSNNKTINFYYVNLNGYRSKKESLKQIIEENNIHILLLTETKVYSKTAIKLSGFQVFSVVRTKRYGSGLAIAIKHGICTAVMIDEGENAEFASVKLIIGSKQIRLILAYGPQEYSSKQEIDDFYENINIQLNRALIAGESVVLAGDFNAKLGKDIIPQDIHDMSSNGKHLLNLINNFELVTMNSYEVCKGIFTRVNNKNCGERSVLDYLFVTTDLCSSISSMIIDEEKLYTPWRNLKKAKRYTDHNAIIFRLNIPTSHKKERKTNKHTMWNFNDMHGWNKFRQVTQDDKQLIDCWNASTSFEACYQQWNNRLNYLMHTCFKKKRVVPRKRLYNREIRQLIRTRKELKRNYNANDDNLCSQLKMLDKRIDKKIAQFNNDIMHNSVGHKPMSKQQFWRLKKTLAPKSISIPHSVMNSFGNEVTDPDNIVNEFRSEFQHRLRIREPQDHIKGYELLHNTLCDLRLQNCTAAKSPDFTITELKAALGELKSGKCADSSGFVREIFSRGGLALLQSMLDMFNRIKKSKTFPLDWNKMYVQTIKKKNGSMKKLNNYRGIFLVPIMSLIFEKLLKNRITPTLKQHMTSFQTGGVKGKGVVDNLFLLRGAIDHCRYLGGELWLTFYDIEKCFDSL